MSDILPDRTTRLTEDESNDLACDWSDYRKDYGISPDPHISSKEHLAFKAGWTAHRNIPTLLCVLTEANDMEAYATAWCDGFENAMAQQHADDPGAADDWLAERDERIKFAVARDLDALLMRVADGDATFAEFVDALATYTTALKETS